MNIDDRKEKILELINQNGKVKVTELSEVFGISDVTIRIDLQDLEKKGLLSRVHGGAVSSYKPYYNMSLGQRLSTNHEQKEKIAEAVAAMIGENDTVMLNSGTTTLLVFRKLKMNMSLSIVTNSIAIALEAAANPNFNVVLLGGSINTKYQFTSGHDALVQLERYHADKLILSVDGISARGVLSTYYDKEAELARQMTHRAGKCIIAADFTKIGRTAFTEITSLTGDDIVVTNECAPKDEVEGFKKLAGEVIIV